MTVGQLVQLLQNYPQDIRVMVDGYEEGWDDLEEHLISARQVRLDAGEEWWEGMHRDAEDTRTEGNGIVDALVLRRPGRIT